MVVVVVAVAVVVVFVAAVAVAAVAYFSDCYQQQFNEAVVPAHTRHVMLRVVQTCLLPVSR